MDPITVMFVMPLNFPPFIITVLMLGGYVIKSFRDDGGVLLIMEVCPIPNQVIRIDVNCFFENLVILLLN